MSWKGFWKGYDWLSRADFANTLAGGIFDYRTWLLALGGSALTFLWAAIRDWDALYVWIATIVVGAGIATIYIAVQFFLAKKRSQRSAQDEAPATVKSNMDSSEKSPILPKPLKELFDTDFPHLGKKTRPIPLNYQNSEQINCVMQVHQAFESGVEFISFYIPRCGKVVEVCDYFANNFRHDYDQLKEQIHFNIRSPGETIMDRSADLRLSGRVYLYHEDEMNYSEYARVTESFGRHDLTPRFRGSGYVADEWRKRLLGQL
jgi:hypothetical protein